jgi:hypothetical protein
MNSCQIFYAIALIICVGGWIGLFYYCFSAPRDHKRLCPEDVVGRTWRAPKKPKQTKTSGHGALPTRLLQKENDNDQTN